MAKSGSNEFCGSASGCNVCYEIIDILHVSVYTFQGFTVLIESPTGFHPIAQGCDNVAALGHLTACEVTV